MVKNKFDKSPKSRFSNTFWRRIFVSPLPKSTIRNVLGDFCRFPREKSIRKIYLLLRTAAKQPLVPILLLSRCRALVTEAGEMPKRRACSVTENWRRERMNMRTSPRVRLGCSSQRDSGVREKLFRNTRSISVHSLS